MNQNTPQIRDMRDFIENYIRATDKCFDTCVTNFNKRSLATHEQICIRSCGVKRVKASQRNQIEFQNVWPKFIERQQKEMELKMLEQQAKTST